MTEVLASLHTRLTVLLAEPIPDETRKAVLARSGGKCEDCGRPATEMHHLRYEDWIGGDLVPVEGRETPADLDHLCHDCHRARHRDAAGGYWRDEDERRGYWATYESEMGRD